jgi:hypothetical protein
MNLSFAPPRRAFLPATIWVILLAQSVPAAQAQHFYDHDRQWKHGGVTSAGTVPEDYIRPVDDSGPISRSTPPFGYSVRPKASHYTQANNGCIVPYYDGATLGDDPGYIPISGSGHHCSSAHKQSAAKKHTAQKTPAEALAAHSVIGKGGLNADDETVYLNGLAILQSQKASTKISKPQKQPVSEPVFSQSGESIFYRTQGASTPLIVGGSGTTFTMQGRGQY